MPINYALANKQHRNQKSALTRAINHWKRTGDNSKIADACYDALREWKVWGAWPDDWHRWNIALLDASGTSLDEFESVMKW